MQLIDSLHAFILRAKTATYVGGGAKLLPYRLGSKDLQFRDGDWAYHDSYVGESDFMGEELVYYQDQVVWGMNYFGRILRPDLTTAAEMGQMIMQSLSRMYAEGRFLGAFEHSAGSLRYVDSNSGDVTFFTGLETIYRDDEPVYELVYHGGLIKN
ncbi:MAG: hypothetical protein GXY36_18900 [Chloroflexi bacterium]|nr:hypothetical protein [Chloroflexota bacterium]